MSRALEWVLSIIDPTPILATVFMICMGYELRRYPVVFPTAAQIEEETEGHVARRGQTA